MLKPLSLPVCIALAACVLMPSPALAYIGPGAGLGAVAVTVALVLGVFLLLVGLVWYPLKRMLRKNKQTAAKDGAENKAE